MTQHAKSEYKIRQVDNGHLPGEPMLGPVGEEAKIDKHSQLMRDMSDLADVGWGLRPLVMPLRDRQAVIFMRRKMVEGWVRPAAK